MDHRNVSKRSSTLGTLGNDPRLDLLLARQNNLILSREGLLTLDLSTRGSIAQTSSFSSDSLAGASRSTVFGVSVFGHLTEASLKVNTFN